MATEAIEVVAAPTRVGVVVSSMEEEEAAICRAPEVGVVEVPGEAATVAATEAATMAQNAQNAGKEWEASNMQHHNQQQDQHQLADLNTP